jgi:hypothetical protein
MTAREARTATARPQAWLDDDSGPYAAGYEDGWRACEDHWWLVICAVRDLQEAMSMDHEADAEAIAERMAVDD